MYMTIPIAIILISISRTCLITINLKKRFRTSDSSTQQQQPLPDLSVSIKLETIVRCQSISMTNRLSNSFISSPSSTTIATTTNQSHRLIQSRRRRTRLDAQMVILISINVAPFILVHIITEIAYLFEKYSTAVAQSTFARLIIIFIYLSWYLISATRFYTNCLLSRIYREEFRNRLYMLRHGCKPRYDPSLRRPSSRYFLASMINVAGGGESTAVNLK